MAATYSHLNGVEYLMVHKPALWGEVLCCILARGDPASDILLIAFAGNTMQAD